MDESQFNDEPEGDGGSANSSSTGLNYSCDIGCTAEKESASATRCLTAGAQDRLEAPSPHFGVNQ